MRRGKPVCIRLVNATGSPHGVSQKRLVYLTYVKLNWTVLVSNNFCLLFTAGPRSISAYCIYRLNKACEVVSPVRLTLFHMAQEQIIYND